MKIRHRFLSVLIAVLMLFAMIPFTASAEEELRVVGATVVREPYVTTCFSGAEEDTSSLGGVVIEYELSDGTKEFWGFDYCHIPDLGGNRVGWDFIRDENGEIIKDGGFVTLVITCDKTAVEIKYTIVENPLESFEISMDPIVIYENYSDRFWDVDMDVYYYFYEFDTDDTITAHYKDGTTVTEEALFFVDEFGYGVELFHTQDVNPWVVGGENYLYAKYLGQVVAIPVDMQPVPIKDIEVTKLPDKYEYYENYEPLWQGMELKLHLGDGTFLAATVDEADLEYEIYPYVTYTFNVGDYEVTIYGWDGEFIIECFGVEKKVEGLVFAEPKAISGMNVKQICRTGVDTIVDVEYDSGEIETFEFDVVEHDEVVRDYDISGLIKTDRGYVEYCVHSVYDEGKNLTGFELYFLGDVAFAPADVIVPVPGVSMVGDADEDGKITVKDATAIQKHLADILVLSDAAAVAANVIYRDNLNIRDATEIQKYIAGYDVIYPIGEAI